MSSDNKMKGLLKGLRFISQIFDNEKQQEIEIGHPTDVKHVAHIGWDGPSENAPGWMSEFKSVPGISSAPSGDMHCQGSDNDDPVPVKGVSSADTTRRGGSRSSVNHQSLEDIPSKSSKRQTNSTGNTRECHAKEKSDRPRQSKKSSKHTQQPPPNGSFKGSKTTDQQPPNDNSLQLQGNNNDLPPRNLPADKTKRTYSKKTRDAHVVGSGSSKSRSKLQPKDKDPNTNEEQQHTRSSSKTRNKHRHSQQDDDDGQLIDRGSNEDVLQSYTN